MQRYRRRAGSFTHTAFTGQHRDVTFCWNSFSHSIYIITMEGGKGLITGKQPL
jgi:hypothetical protein